MFASVFIVSVIFNEREEEIKVAATRVVNLIIWFFIFINYFLANIFRLNRLINNNFTVINF